MNLLVLGIGNIICNDEGVGVYLAKMLEKNFNFSSDSNIDFLDGGTLAHALIPIICKYDEVIIIDCIDADDSKVGDIYFFDFDDIPNYINFSGSAHEIEMFQALKMMDLLGDKPRTKILGIVPKRIEPMGIDLSNEILVNLNLAIQTILNYIKSIGFEYTKKIEQFTINDILNSYKRKSHDTNL